jgi:hypothetical protein
MTGFLYNLDEHLGVMKSVLFRTAKILTTVPDRACTVEHN